MNDHRRIRELQGLGAKSEEIIRLVGITTVDQFMSSDPFEIYRELKVLGSGISLNLLYAMIGAQEEINWQKVVAERKTEILMRLDDMGIAP